MKTVIGFLTVGVMLLALPASQFFVNSESAPTVVAPTIKGHVPVGKVQVCHKGEVITVSENSLDSHLGAHGDCRLPACDFNNVFFTGDPCDSNNPGGMCSLPNQRDNACGVTPGCPAGPGCF